MNNVDSYMNLIMTDAEEISNGKTVANYGKVIEEEITCFLSR